MTVNKDLQQIRLTLSRLNDMWSFTQSPMTYQVEMLLRISPDDDVENILYAIRGYGCLSAAAGYHIGEGINPPDEWTRLFSQCGQRLMFGLPEYLKYFDKRRFQKQAAKNFMVGFKTCTPSPSGGR
jgi:hypothetical protein